MASSDQNVTFDKSEIMLFKGRPLHAPLLILLQVVVVQQVLVPFQGVLLDGFVQAMVHLLNLVGLFRLPHPRGRVVLVGLLRHAENVHFFGPTPLGLVLAPGAGARGRHAVMFLFDVRVERGVGKILLAAAAVMVSP